jgi:putative phage-type endonuclease
MTDRRKFIGGSDAPAILGLSPWKTPYQLYLEKRGELEGHGDSVDPDNDPMFWGKTLEPIIRQRYADKTGKRIVVPSAPIIHPQHGWMGGSLDGVTDDQRVFEAKNTRVLGEWGEPETDAIPEMYLVQVQHYLAVTQFSVADVAVLIGGNDFRIYHIEADIELQALIIEREAAFWSRVQNGDPPPPLTYSDMQKRYGKASTAIVVQASPEAVEAVNRIKQLKEIQEQEETLKAFVMGEMGEADTLSAGDKILATWKAAKAAKRFDQKAFEADHPELYAQYCKDGNPTRRLLIK